jgi:Tfp pilus assembly protein PilF
MRCPSCAFRQPVQDLRLFGGVLLLLLASQVLAGCGILRRPAPTRYSTLPENQTKSFAEASDKNAKGLRALEKGNLDKAETLFQEALAAEPNHGPAHNNLGQVYLARNQLYLAAWEFELAASLMPGDVRPMINQGVVYELARRFDRAGEYYQVAYEVSPQNPDVIGCLVRLRIKEKGDPDEIRMLLHELLLYESRPEWLSWAEEKLLTQYSLRNQPMEAAGATWNDGLDGTTRSEAGELPGPVGGAEVIPVPEPHPLLLPAQQDGASSSRIDSGANQVRQAHSETFSEGTGAIQRTVEIAFPQSREVVRDSDKIERSGQ